MIMATCKFSSPPEGSWQPLSKLQNPVVLPQKVSFPPKSSRIATPNHQNVFLTWALISQDPDFEMSFVKHIKMTKCHKLDHRGAAELPGRRTDAVRSSRVEWRGLDYPNLAMRAPHVSPKLQTLSRDCA